MGKASFAEINDESGLVQLYLNSDEFNTYEEITRNNQEEPKSFTADTTTDSSADYVTDDYMIIVFLLE